MVVSGIILDVLTALVPPMMLYVPNITELSFSQMLPYFGIMAGLGLLAWAGMYLVTRRRKGLAAIAAALWLAVMLNIGRAIPALHTVFPLAGLKIVLPVTLLILVAATYGLSRLSDEFLGNAVKVAVLAMAAFFLSSAVPAAVNAMNRKEPVTAENPYVDLTPAENADRPNFYWIVSDEYAGKLEMEKYYHYDISPFFSRLRGMGFTVSENSYNWSTSTYEILRDCMNLNYFAGEKQDTKELRIAVANPDAPLWSLFRSLGYEVCEAETMDKFRLTNRMKFGARDNAPQTEEGDTVAGLLLRYSILYRYENEILDRVLPAESKETEREIVQGFFEWGQNPSSYRADGPTCTILYVKSPHVPYLFREDGSFVPEEHWRDREDKQYYRGQHIYVSEQLGNICETIIRCDPDSVILLQSDHGMRHVANITWLDSTNVLNAVYFRGQPMEEIEGKNGLNTWRAVLRKQFNLDLPELEEPRLANTYRRDYYDPEKEDPNQGLIP